MKTWDENVKLIQFFIKCLERGGLHWEESCLMYFLGWIVAGGVRGFPVGLSGAFLSLIVPAALCLVQWTLGLVPGLGPLL